jgi:flagella basal body P-ring formation protein FlgA
VIGESLIAAGAGNSVVVHINGANMQDNDTVATAGAPINAEVDNLQLDKAHSRWQATLLLKANDRNIAPVNLSGHYEETAQIPVLKRPLQSGDVISESDIEWSQQPVTHLRKAIITDPKDMIGKSPKRMISQDRPVRIDEIASPALINKGARITLLYKSQALVIKTLGEAMDRGAKGDVIRVKNVESKQIIEGTVETGDIVRVTSPDSTAAEAL